jgi:CRISPR-associated protein Cas5d
MNNHPPLEIRIWGDFACFTRPDMKVERVTYPVMTPSAARGVLEAVFWKPEFQWQIREIQVLKEIRYFSILRNETNSKISVSSVQRWEQTGEHYCADEDRAQRHSLILRDVDYLIKAEPVLKPHATDNVAKYRDQFRRRLKKGQCYHIPYLGCREFSAFFSEPSGDEKPINYSSDLGSMLFDLDFRDNVSGGTPIFFRARIDNGILTVPPRLYKGGTVNVA